MLKTSAVQNRQDRPQRLRAGTVIYIKATVQEDHGDGAVVAIANSRGSSTLFVGTSEIQPQLL